MKRHHLIIAVAVLLLIGVPVAHVVRSQFLSQRERGRDGSASPDASGQGEVDSRNGGSAAATGNGRGGSSQSATDGIGTTRPGTPGTGDFAHATSPAGADKGDPASGTDEKLEAPLPKVAGGLRFCRSGMAAGILRDVKRVANKSEVRVAVETRGKARLVCILVEGGKRYAVLDRGAELSRLGRGFAAPPLPVAKTMSIYRSLAKRRIDHKAEQGDAVVVLLCPVDGWDGLDLRWPDLAPERP